MKSKKIGAMTMQILVVLALPFLAAGTLFWPAGWVFAGILFLFALAVRRVLAQGNRELAAERQTVGQADREVWDRRLMGVGNIAALVWLVVMPLDAVRFGWTVVPLSLQIAGGAALAFALYIIYLTFRENAYLSHVVRVQKDRGQMVISTGPYARVRHPMYAGLIILFPASSLLLGSWLGLIPALVMDVIFVARAVMEEQTLRRRLEGYQSYTEQVPHRMIPGVW